MRRCFALLASTMILQPPGSAAYATPAAPPAVPAPSAALDCGLWIGRLGELPVATWLQPGKGQSTIEGRYGYLRLGKPIPLDGRKTATGFQLEEHGARNRGLSGQWEVAQRKSSSGRVDLTGTWRSPDKKRELAIDMACVAASDGTVVDGRYRPQIGRGSLAKKFKRLLHAGMIAGTVERVGVATMSEVTDVKGARAYPQLVSLPNPEAMKEINTWIRKESAKSVTDEPAGDDRTCSEEVTLTVLHASANHVTVYEVTEDDCGVHPEEDETLVTFDTTGPHAVQVDLASLMNIDATPSKRKKFMRSVLKQRERESGPGEELDGDCDWNEGVPPSFSFGVVRNGILVDVDHGAHLTEPCDFQVTLPHRVVKQFLSSDAPRAIRDGKY